MRRRSSSSLCTHRRASSKLMNTSGDEQPSQTLTESNPSNNSNNNNNNHEVNNFLATVRQTGASSHPRSRSNINRRSSHTAEMTTTIPTAKTGECNILTQPQVTTRTSANGACFADFAIQQDLLEIAENKDDHLSIWNISPNKKPSSSSSQQQFARNRRISSRRASRASSHQGDSNQIRTSKQQQHFQLESSTARQGFKFNCVPLQLSVGEDLTSLPAGDNFIIQSKEDVPIKHYFTPAHGAAAARLFRQSDDIQKKAQPQMSQLRQLSGEYSHQFQNNDLVMPSSKCVSSPDGNNHRLTSKIDKLLSELDEKPVGNCISQQHQLMKEDSLKYQYQSYGWSNNPSTVAGPNIKRSVSVMHTRNLKLIGRTKTESRQSDRLETDYNNCKTIVLNTEPVEQLQSQQQQQQQQQTLSLLSREYFYYLPTRCYPIKLSLMPKQQQKQRTNTSIDSQQTTQTKPSHASFMVNPTSVSAAGAVPSNAVLDLSKNVAPNSFRIPFKQIHRVAAKPQQQHAKKEGQKGSYQNLKQPLPIPLEKYSSSVGLNDHAVSSAGGIHKVVVQSMSGKNQNKRSISMLMSQDQQKSKMNFFSSVDSQQPQIEGGLSESHWKYQGETGQVTQHLQPQLSYLKFAEEYSISQGPQQSQQQNQQQAQQLSVISVLSQYQTLDSVNERSREDARRLTTNATEEEEDSQQFHVLKERYNTTNSQQSNMQPNQQQIEAHKNASNKQQQPPQKHYAIPSNRSTKDKHIINSKKENEYHQLQSKPVNTYCEDPGRFMLTIDSKLSKHTPPISVKPPLGSKQYVRKKTVKQTESGGMLVMKY